MSDAIKPPLHGRDHRPIHFLGEDDPGGADPWCDWDDVAFSATDGWGYGRFINVSVDPGVILTGGFYTDIDFTTANIRTNDSGFETADLAPSPFVGDHFSIDWSTTPNKIHITGQGQYTIRRMFRVISFGLLTYPSDLYTIGVGRTMNGSPKVNDAYGGAGLDVKTATIIPTTFIDANGDPNVELVEEWFVESPGNMSVGMTVYQNSGINTVNQVATLTIIRRGDQNHS